MSDWSPVTTPPHVEGVYLVAWARGPVGIAKWAPDLAGRGGWLTWCADCERYANETRPTHWMPLPEPPHV